MKKLKLSMYPLLRSLAALATLAMSLAWSQGAAAATTQAAPANCSAPYAIDVALANGARWSLCWEERRRQGIILRDIRYTPPGKEAIFVFAQVNPAQVHVPYDDNGARFHDETDYGLGGEDLNDLDPQADCPNGSVYSNNGRNVLCSLIVDRGYAIKYYSEVTQGQLFKLFSVSHIGEYNYIFDYSFYDDGTMEFAVGATGQLQRYTADPEAGSKYGWPVGRTEYGISHVHNFYWRLDFDLGGQVAGVRTNAVEELGFPPEDETSERRVLTSQVFESEAARPVAPTEFRSWRVKSTLIDNENRHPISYQLEADPAHLFHGPSYEPFTQDEVYVTVQKTCEQFASHNGGGPNCGDNLAEFVNGEPLTGADLVVWYGQAFHHLPHDEDSPRMNAHWSRFFIRPLDLVSQNPMTLPEASGQDAHEHSHTHSH